MPLTVLASVHDNSRLGHVDQERKWPCKTPFCQRPRTLRDGASHPDAGRWKSSRLPALYTEKQTAGGSTAACYYQEKGG